MIENILNALETSTPALRERYLERIRSVEGEQARELEQRLVSMMDAEQTQH